MRLISHSAVLLLGLALAPNAQADGWPFATASTGSSWFAAPTIAIAGGGMPGISLSGGLVTGGNWKVNARDGFAAGIRLDALVGIDAYGGAVGGTLASTFIENGGLRSYVAASPRFLFGREWGGNTYWGADLRHSIWVDKSSNYFIPPVFFFGIGYYKREVTGGSYFWDGGFGF